MPDEQYNMLLNMERIVLSQSANRENTPTPICPPDKSGISPAVLFPHYGKV